MLFFRYPCLFPTISPLQPSLTHLSFFKTLVDHDVTVELKNDISIKGTLKSVDQYLNIKLENIQVLDEVSYPHLSSVKHLFIRGSVVRYVHLPAAAVDTALLEDATRRGELAYLGVGDGDWDWILGLTMEQRRRVRLEDGGNKKWSGSSGVWIL